jgi:2-polyprenyl-3-methyl-5-hydroxy-6-metoxy-1,4-benzoquinol methylase
MDFKSRFDAVICIDAMEHVFPEDWPEIVAAFHQALKPGGWLYFTVEVADVAEVKLSYDHAIALGLPVVPGEIADKVEPACEKILQMDLQDIPDELADEAVYHFYPALEQVRDWLSKAGFILQAEGLGHWYAHFLAQKVLQPLS